MALTLTPWRQHKELRPYHGRNLDELLNRFFELDVGESDEATRNLPEVYRRGFVPSLNLAESDTGYTITLELPGLEEKDFEVQLMGTRLVVSGERHWKEEKQEKEFHRVESRFGSFSRSVELPDGFNADPSKIQAHFDRGVLRIVVPKTEPTPTAKIKVKAT